MTNLLVLLLKHASSIQHFKEKYTDPINTKYAVEIWYRIA